jgi:YHS domain-containing protein
MFGFSQKIIDPVCKMKLDKKTEFSEEFEGTKYSFCSENCKGKFNAEPKKYIAKKENVPAKKSCCG